MQLLILCDRSSNQYNDLNLREKVKKIAEGAGYHAEMIVLNSDEIEPCKGCYGCWIKTPGICVITGDGVNSIARKFIQADTVLLLSEVTYGGYSPDIKAFLDRNIPSMLPFFEKIEGQMHHPKRYARYPNWIALGYGDVTDTERDTFIELEKRNALNFHPPKDRCHTVRTTEDLKNVLDEIQDFLIQEMAV